MQRGLWNSVSVGSGAQSVMRAGVVVMLQWCASWDSREQVNCNINTTSIIAVITLIILTCILYSLLTFAGPQQSSRWP